MASRRTTKKTKAAGVPKRGRKAKSAAAKARELRQKLKATQERLEELEAAAAERSQGMDRATLRNALRATDEDLEALQTIIRGGRGARNALSRIKAIELKLGYAYGRPSQMVQHVGEDGGPVAVEHRVVIEYADEDEPPAAS